MKFPVNCLFTGKYKDESPIISTFAGVEISTVNKISFLFGRKDSPPTTNIAAL